MAIEYRCVKCGKLLRVADQYAGQQAKCPDCGTQMAIPYASAPPSGGAASPPPTSGNPYASPAMGGGATSTSINMNDIFGTTWSIFQREWPTCVVMNLIAAIIPVIVQFGVQFFSAIVTQITKSDALGFLVFLGGLAVYIAVLGTLQASLLRSFLKIARGQPTAIGEIFNIGPDLLPAIGAWILVVILVWVGTFFCVIPGLLALVVFFPSVLLVIDRKVPVFDSLGQSKDLTIGQLWPLCLIWLVAFACAFGITLVTCGVGGLAAGPFLGLMFTVIYLRLTNQPVAK